MRINFYESAEASLAPAERAGQAAAAQDPQPVNGAPLDTAKLSSAADSVLALTFKALQSGEGRSAKVEALRQQVQASTYPLDPAAIADAITRSDV